MEIALYLKRVSSRSKMTRPIPFKDPAFHDEVDLDKELRRVFDICHGCRRCFNLCSLFPKLFDIMDSPEVDGDVEKLTQEHIEAIIPECTLCDMCFMVKCPYVPPHPWNVDFPRLMLRYRAVQTKKTSVRKWVSKQLATVDLYAPLASMCAPVTNKALGCGCMRKISEPFTGIDHRAKLPPFRKPQLKDQWQDLEPNPKGPAYGQEVHLYLTCFSNYYESTIASAAARILTALGIKVHASYPGCCGMPLLEQGQLDEVVAQAKKVAPSFEKASTVIALTPSCTLMLKSEWPSLCPQDMHVQALSKKTYDLCEYLLLFVSSLKDVMTFAIPDTMAVHMACHVRAQNKGNASHTLLKALSGKPIPVIERCSGHGGIWGYTTAHFDQALEVGKPVIKLAQNVDILTSECPLAAQHLRQELELLGQSTPRVMHPVELLAETLTIKEMDHAHTV